MSFDPNYNPLPPLSDGYPDDWHVPPSAEGDGFPDDWRVPPSAEGDGFPDDWHVPPSAEGDGFPDDWHVPPSAEGDGFPDDWFVPESAAVPSASQTTPIVQPNAANPGFTASTAPPPGSIAAYWSRLAADRQRATPWAPPMFPDAFGRFPPSAFAPAPIAQLNASNPTFTPSLVTPSGSVATLSYSNSQPPAPDQLRTNEASDVVSDTSADGGDPNVTLVSGTEEDEEEKKREQERRALAIFNERAFGVSPPRGVLLPRLLPPLGNPGQKSAAAAPQPPPNKLHPLREPRRRPVRRNRPFPATRRRAAVGSATSPSRPKEVPSAAVHFLRHRRRSLVAR